MVRSLALILSLAPLAAASQGLSAYEEFLKTPMEQRHPALHQHIANNNNNRRRLDDIPAQPGFGCQTFDDEKRVECKMQFGGGTYEIDEVCTTPAENSARLDCDVCAQNNGVMLPDGQFVKFCYKFSCSISDVDVFQDGDFSKSCQCNEAHVNGEVCTFCEFCKTDSSAMIPGQTDTQEFEEQVALLTPPLALECPHMDVVNSDCPVPEQGLSGGAITGIIMLVLSCCVGGLVVCLRRKKQRPHVPMGGSSNSSDVI